jgi:hypothetical protein
MLPTLRFLCSLLTECVHLVEDDWIGGDDGRTVSLVTVSLLCLPDRIRICGRDPLPRSQQCACTIRQPFRIYTDNPNLRETEILQSGSFLVWPEWDGLRFRGIHKVCTSTREDFGWLEVFRQVIIQTSGLRFGALGSGTKPLPSAQAKSR